MGYTTLARIQATNWHSRSYKSGTPRRAEGAAPIEETRYVCADCSQYFAFGSECPRCGIPTVDRTRALPASGRHLPRRLVSLPAKGSPGMYLMLLLGIGIPVAYVPAVEFFKSHDPGLRFMLVTWGALAAIALVVPTLVILAGSVRRRRRLRKRARTARAAADRIPTTPTTELPEHATEPVRVRGRVRFDVGPTDVRVRIADAHGTATLPKRPWLRVRSCRGELEELEAVRNGDEVEIVGKGRHTRAAAEGYREAEQEFVFDGSEPLEVWVAEHRSSP